MRHAGKGGRFLGHGDRLRALLADDLVHAFQKFNGFQVFAPAMPVGKPFARLAAVVAVQHGRHRINAQAVHIEPLQPVQRIADQEITHLGAAQVVNQGVPVVVEAFTRIGVFVQRRAVEIAQAVRVGWKVRRHPVEQHADASRMAAGHKARKAVGIAESRRRRIQADRLVAPGAVERMLADRQQFDVGKAHVQHIGHQHLRHFVPGQPALRAACRVGNAPP